MMFRGNPAPWFRPSRNSFYLTLNAKQMNLQTADEAEALRLRHKLMSDDGPVLEAKPSISAIVLLADFA